MRDGVIVGTSRAYILHNDVFAKLVTEMIVPTTFPAKMTRDYRRSRTRM